jgi:hypothetical protein
MDRFIFKRKTKKNYLLKFFLIAFILAGSTFFAEAFDSGESLFGSHSEEVMPLVAQRADRGGY